MKLHVIFAILLVLLITACTTVQPQEPQSTQTVHDLTLNQQDVTQLNLVDEGCDPQQQYTMCNYTSANGDEIIIQLWQQNNESDLKGAYDYNSLHLIDSDYFISENTYGDQSRFEGWNESTTYYYHLWTTKDLFLIHVTSKGGEQAKDDVIAVGQTILAKIQ